MSLTAYPTLRLKLTMPQALKLQFLPTIPSAQILAATNKVDRAGDTMTGNLILNGDPSAALQAATKQYVDVHAGDIAVGDKGDITVSGGGGLTWTIDNDVVTYAKMQNVSAAGRFLARITAGAGDVEEATGTQATALLDAFTSSLKGLAPSSGGGTTNFLRADGSWAAAVGTAVGFSAHKNGTDQTGVAVATPTKVTFGTEIYDRGALFDTANSRWTPPAGMIHLDAGLFVALGLTNNTELITSIFKNGSLFKRSGQFTFGGTGSSQASITDVANGTDFYEVFVTGQSGASFTVNGTITHTFFMGFYVGP